ncbi:SWIM zinc finger family protein [Streptomyces sp. NPDC046197]|uniref:SWIM zinc finger family protein n=1 Tax=Streptomyces sp. NPDC046197 TaxID=3154337 RepID=UPI0033C4FFDE
MRADAARGSSQARPADAARRALRAAREHALPPAEEAADPDPAPGGPTARSARPADAARAALRDAVSARRADPVAGGPPAGNEPQPSTESPDLPDGSRGPGRPVRPGRRPAERPDGPPGSAAAPEGDDEAGRRGARPADAVREALRAARARDEAQTQKEATGTAAGAAEEARRAPRPVPSADRRPSNLRDRGVEERDGDVRKLLAEAMAMPSTAAAPGDVHPDNGVERQGDWPAPAALSSPSVEGPGDPLPAGSPVDAPYAPAAARVPRTMASPRRDGELRRTFPPLPPWQPEKLEKPEESEKSEEPEQSAFAETWWGNAWVTALEEGALDAARLARGRGYARKGNVDAITVTPGLVLAYVQGSRARPYRVQVRLRTLDDAAWERFLDAAAERPGHIAALLDKEMPHSLADCGVPLLPGPGDLEPHCSCPDNGHPCKHAAALCYQTARLLDADPFVLLLLRGRGERELLDALSRLSAARAARAAQNREPEPLPGVRASDALAEGRLPPPPPPLPPPPHPGQPPVYPAAPGGPDPFALDQLATDAAARAHALLTTGRDPVGELTLWQDAVRLAAGRPGSGLTGATRALYAALASAAGRTPAGLARAVAAWRQGGLEGLAVLEEPWDPPAGKFDRARPLLLAADLPAFRPWRNHLTHPRGHVQLRLGRDGLWYAYESEPGHDDWWPRGTPDLDPVGALTGLGTPSDL